MSAAGLIEMNARMVTTETSDAVYCIGVAAVAMFAVLAVIAWLLVEKRRGLTIGVCVALAVAGAVMIVVANNMPKVKEVRCCASGPVSLEMVAGVYDIVSVDGKELVLREK